MKSIFLLGLLLLFGGTVAFASDSSQPQPPLSPAAQAVALINQIPDQPPVQLVMYQRYPDMPISGNENPGHSVLDKLIDLGSAAIPPLIAALDDKRPTPISEESLSREIPLTVGRVAQMLLEFISAHNFYPEKTDDGRLVRGTTRQQVDAWWAEVQQKGEKQALIETLGSNNEYAVFAAYRLVYKYPDAALPAIQAALNASTNDGVKSELLEAAAKIPGDASLSQLKSQLAAETGLDSKIAAAVALQDRKQPEALPAMISAWNSLQPRLATAKDGDFDIRSQAGQIIVFLASSGSTAAIDALRQQMPAALPDVRLAEVMAFLPMPKTPAEKSGGTLFSEPIMTVSLDDLNIPPGKPTAALQRLLTTALHDTVRIKQVEMHYIGQSYKDPRICDMAAFILSRRWPARYAFNWTPDEANCDQQIAKVLKQG